MPRFALNFLYRVLPPSFMNHHHFFMHFFCNLDPFYTLTKRIVPSTLSLSPSKEIFPASSAKGADEILFYG